MVRISVELVQDAKNIESKLQSVVLSAIAGAIDRAGLLRIDPTTTRPLVSSESTVGSLQGVVLAYARADLGVVLPQSFCTLEGIMV